MHNTWIVYVRMRIGSPLRYKILDLGKNFRRVNRNRDEETMQGEFKREGEDADPFDTLGKALIEKGFTIMSGRDVQYAPIGYKLIAYIRDSLDQGILTVWQRA